MKCFGAINDQSHENSDRCTETSDRQLKDVQISDQRRPHIQHFNCLAEKVGTFLSSFHYSLKNDKPANISMPPWNSTKIWDEASLLTSRLE
ncbi:unnamed protein product [Gongylonema pulchrum]|uniref:Ovule protein n=1 Tax=Gongylonema pulchrum TaxID=637853 RepID=A0A183D849_9BILA|nr:unnamed protein product [Gongylonema pulchrum]